MKQLFNGKTDEQWEAATEMLIELADEEAMNTADECILVLDGNILMHNGKPGLKFENGNIFISDEFLDLMDLDSNAWELAFGDGMGEWDNPLE